MTKKNQHELSIEKKAIIVGMFKAGKTCSAISRDLRYPQTTISSVVCHFKTCNTVETLKQTGCPKTLNTRNLRVLAHELKENCQTKMANIAELLPINVSTRTARHQAHEIGFHN